MVSRSGPRSSSHPSSLRVREHYGDGARLPGGLGQGPVYAIHEREPVRQVCQGVVERGRGGIFLPGSTHTNTQGEAGSRPAAGPTAPCPNLREREARRRSSPRREPPWRASATRGLRGRSCTGASRPLPPDQDELLGRSITTYGVVSSTCGTAGRPNATNSRVPGCSRPAWCACRTLL